MSLSSHMANILAHLEATAAPESLYSCNVCRDTGMECVDPRGHGTWRRCNHSGRGMQTRDRLGFPDRVPDAPWSAAPRDVHEWAHTCEAGAYLHLGSEHPLTVQSVALLVARQLVSRSFGVVRYFEATGAPREFGQRWEIEATQGAVVVIGGVDGRMNAPQIDALARAMKTLESKTLIIAGAPFATLSGDRWGPFIPASAERNVKAVVCNGRVA